MWQKIDNVLGKYKKSQDKTLLASWVCHVAQAIGKYYDFSVVSFNNNILTISLPSNVLAQEIRFKEKKIITEINQRLKKDLVKRICYRIN
ncbi:MAG: DUF721 domain-containing protein [Patescibacteria group bacterium]|nr:DUF721 domain-containing protein [Patescibacteria group bacterium]